MSWGVCDCLSQQEQVQVRASSTSLNGFPPGPGGLAVFLLARFTCKCANNSGASKFGEARATLMWTLAAVKALHLDC